MTAQRIAEERVLVLAPYGRDAELTHSILREHDLLSKVCDGMDEVEAGIRGGAAVILVTEEALNDQVLERLVDVLSTQETWSDLPIIVFTRAEARREVTDRIANRFDVTVVERPVRMATLISVVRAALRARRRQYEVRSLLLQLEETDRRKDEFLAMLGHELRNPLAGVQTAADILGEDELDDETVDNARRVIARQAANLSRMVDDLLEVSRVTRGKIQLETESIDVSPLLHDCVESLRGRAEAVGQTLDFESCREPCWVEGDPVRLEQVITNLLTNAIKYTPDGGHIRAKADATGDEVVIRVTDDGIGIAPDMLPRVFDPFTQVDPGVDRAKGGLGLGLPVVRSLVELHGGHVRAESAGPGQGSEFTVTLPRLADERVSIPDAGAPAQYASPGPQSVLLVDDDEDISMLMGGMLRRWGYEVRTAPNGELALGVMSEWMPDIALVDIGMPVMDGYALARTVRELHGGQAPELIAMTGYGQPEDKQRAMDAGFRHHLTKPVEASLLRRLLEQISD